MTAQGRLGVIAGGGNLPWRAIAHAQESGRNPFIIGVDGFVDPQQLAAADGVLVSIGEFGRHIRLLNEAGCKQIVFAGIVRRPDFSKLRLDFKGAREIPAIIAAAAKGDDVLLRAVIRVFEQAGFEVIGVDEVFGGLLAPQGALGRHAPSEAHMQDISLALAAVLRLGELDIGQGAVVRDGVTLAVEAEDGTDAMLARCALTDRDLSIGKRSGVLVKAPKPIQERRIDLPTIGEETIRRAQLAHLAGVAVEAGGALIIDREETIKCADEAGLFIYGFDPAELA